MPSLEKNITDQINKCPVTPCTLHHYRIEGFKGGPQLVRHYAERCQSLGFSCQYLNVWKNLERHVCK